MPLKSYFENLTEVEKFALMFSILSGVGVILWHEPFRSDLGFPCVMWSEAGETFENMCFDWPAIFGTMVFVLLGGLAIRALRSLPSHKLKGGAQKKHHAVVIESDEKYTDGVVDRESYLYM